MSSVAEFLGGCPMGDVSSVTRMDKEPRPSRRTRGPAPGVNRPDGSGLSTAGLVYLFAERLLRRASYSFSNTRARLPSGARVDHAELSALLLTVAVLGLRERGVVALEQQGPAVLVRLTAPLELPRRWRRGRRILGRVYPMGSVEDLVKERLAGHLASLSDRGQLAPESAAAVGGGWYRPPPEVTVSWGDALEGLLFADGSLETSLAGLTHRLGWWVVDRQERGDLEARFEAWLRQREQLSGPDAELVDHLECIARARARAAASALDV